MQTQFTKAVVRLFLSSLRVYVAPSPPSVCLNLFSLLIDAHLELHSHRSPPFTETNPTTTSLSKSIGHKSTTTTTKYHGKSFTRASEHHFRAAGLSELESIHSSIVRILFLRPQIAKVKSRLYPSQSIPFYARFTTRKTTNFFNMRRFFNNNHGHGWDEDDESMCRNILCAFVSYSPTASGLCHGCQNMRNQEVQTNPRTAPEARALQRQDHNRDLNERHQEVEDLSHREFQRQKRLNAQNNRGALRTAFEPREPFVSTLYTGERSPAAGSAHVPQQPHQLSPMQQGRQNNAGGPSTGHAHAGSVRAPAPNTAGSVNGPASLAMHQRREHSSASTSTGGAYPVSTRMRQPSSATATPAPSRTETTRQRIEQPAPVVNSSTGAADPAIALEQARNVLQMRYPIHFANTVTPPGATYQPNQSRTSQAPHAHVLRPRRGRSNLAGDFVQGRTSSQQAPVQQMTPGNDVNTSVPQDANMPRLPPAAHLPDNSRGHRYEDQILSPVMPRPQSSFDTTPHRDPSIPQVTTSAGPSSNTRGSRFSQQILTPVLPPAAPSFDITRHQDPIMPRIPAPSHFPDAGPATPAHHISWARGLPPRPSYADPNSQVTPPSPSSAPVPTLEAEEAEANRSTIIASTSDESAVLFHYQEEEREEEFRPCLHNGTHTAKSRIARD